jgi:glyoxylase-like metal-dependent hydrolase (beta-lactamase superfamily II)
MIGRADWENLVQKNPITMPETLAPWRAPGPMSNPSKVIAGDKDIFGDGSVVMLRTPGHTAGHHSPLVRLPKFGAVILSGDLWNISEQLNDNGVKAEISDRANVLASRDRILKLASNLKAKLIIQHEPSDVSKLPPFPASAQ